MPTCPACSERAAAEGRDLCLECAAPVPAHVLLAAVRRLDELAATFDRFELHVPHGMGYPAAHPVRVLATLLRSSAVRAAIDAERGVAIGKVPHCTEPGCDEIAERVCAACDRHRCEDHIAFSREADERFCRTDALTARQLWAGYSPCRPEEWPKSREERALGNLGAAALARKVL